MKIILILGFLVFNVSKADTTSLEKSCLSSDGLACAKLGYQYKKNGDFENALKFYKKGCELKDESSCFNMKGVDPKSIYYKKADAIMKFHAQNISSCYAPDLKRKSSTGQFKEKWNRAEIDMHIDKTGFSDKIEIKTNLNSNFIDCAKKIISKIEFPKPLGIDPIYHYQLMMKSLE